LTAFDAAFRKREMEKTRKPAVAVSSSKSDNSPEKKTRFH